MMSNCNGSNRPLNQKQLLDWIDKCSFVLDDTLLFLDTHPCDKEALQLFEHFKQLREEALMEYARRYTPLTLDSMNDNQNEWKWVMGKWPWEGGNC